MSTIKEDNTLQELSQSDSFEHGNELQFHTSTEFLYISAILAFSKFTRLGVVAGPVHTDKQFPLYFVKYTRIGKQNF